MGNKKENKNKRESYSRAGEGDDERANDQLNKEWEKKYWSHFFNEINGRTKNDKS
jgi:hypothetical protein